MYNNYDDVTHFKNIAEELKIAQEQHFRKEMTISCRTQKTNVSIHFFSNKNIDYLQQQIRHDVFMQTLHDNNGDGIRIPNQSRDTLSIIMRSIYLTHGRNLNRDIDKQVNCLNKKVLEYAVPSIITQIKQRSVYNDQVGKLVIPLDQPRSTRTFKGELFDIASDARGDITKYRNSTFYNQFNP